MKNTMLRRVKAGVAFLDSVMTGWRKKINLKNLDLSDSCNCVLGQLDSNYDDHKAELELTDKVAYDLGFHEDMDGSFYSPSECDWDKLTSTWKKEIKK